MQNDTAKENFYENTTCPTDNIEKYFLGPFQTPVPGSTGSDRSFQSKLPRHHFDQGGEE